MARDENVMYECDVCHRKARAQEVRPPGNSQPFYIRPEGWGVMSALVQIDGGRVKDKADFCGEKCARERFEELMHDGYPA